MKTILFILLASLAFSVRAQERILVVVKSAGIFGTNNDVKPWTDAYKNPLVHIINHTLPERVDQMTNSTRARMRSETNVNDFHKILVVECAEESLLENKSAADIYDTAIKLLGRARADGFHTTLCTCPPSPSFTVLQNIERIKYNTLVKFNSNKSYDNFFDLEFIQDARFPTSAEQTRLATDLPKHLKLP